MEADYDEVMTLCHQMDITIREIQWKDKGNKKLVRNAYTKQKYQVKEEMMIGYDPLEWQEVNTEHIIRDEWIDFRKTSWRFPDGNVVGPFYSYTRKDYVVIVASDPEGNYICVRQFRQGIRKVTTEFPAGAIERKDGSRNDDSPITEADALTAAKRELLEETGYESDDWKHLITVPSNATMADNFAFIFEAKNCRKVAGQDLDATEFINIEELPAQKIDEMIETGEFPQAVHIVAWLKSRG